MSLSRPTMSALRFGYGIRPGENPPDGPAALMAQLKAAAKAPLRFPAEGIEGRYETIAGFIQQTEDARTDDKVLFRKRMQPVRRAMYRALGIDQHARIIQATTSPYGFHERLASFWFEHFAVSQRKNPMMMLIVPLYEAEALRPNLGGSFTALLKAAVLHPAMLIYLDQVRSRGPNSTRGQKTALGLNENLGRELLELHTLGVDGGYKQQDVRDAALILTGMFVDRHTSRTDFREGLAEPGPLTFMGKTYGGRERSMQDIDDLLTDLAAMPQTARHICRKLAAHFVSDTPPAPLVDAMVDAWKTGDGNLTVVYTAMVNHPAAWENPGEKARLPFDYIVAGLRALDVPEKALRMPEHDDGADVGVMAAPSARSKTAGNDMVPDMAGDMAMDENAGKKNAAGKKADNKAEKSIRAPLNPLTVRVLAKLGQPVWEASSPAGIKESFDTWVSSSQLTGRIEWAQRVSSRFGGRMNPTDLLKEVLRDAARDDTITVVRQAPSRSAGLALVLASPEFNRR